MPDPDNHHLATLGADPSTSTRMTSGGARTGQSGIVLVQVVVAMCIIALCGAGGLRALIEINRKAAAMRTLNQARAIVQKNIDTALGVDFSKTTGVPAILGVTTGSTSNENIVISHVGNNVITGTLTRVVSQVSADPDIRRVTFRLNYGYRLKTYAYEMTTIRSID